MNSLSKEDKKELDSAFKSSKTAKEQNRIQVVRLCTKGYSHKEVTEITGKSLVTIRELVAKYNKEGINGLLLKPHPRNNSKLTLKQKEKVKRILTNNEIPSKAGLKIREEEDLWSIKTLKLLIKKLFNVEYQTKESYRKLFKDCGYSYQKVEFEDERRKNEEGEEFQKRLQMKLKKGDMSMWW